MIVVNELGHEHKKRNIWNWLKCTNYKPAWMENIFGMIENLIEQKKETVYTNKFVPIWVLDTQNLFAI